MEVGRSINTAAAREDIRNSSKSKNMKNESDLSEQLKLIPAVEMVRVGVMIYATKPIRSSKRIKDV